MNAGAGGRRVGPAVEGMVVVVLARARLSLRYSAMADLHVPQWHPAL